MDKIVYLKISNGGGVDGMDRTDKGGAILAASFQPHGVKADGWSHIEKRVVDDGEAKKSALAKLDPLDTLVLGLVKDAPTHR